MKQVGLEVLPGPHLQGHVAAGLTGGKQAAEKLPVRR